MKQHLWEYGIIYIIGIVLAATLIFAGVGLYMGAKLDREHPCIEWGEEYYRAPTYIKVGNVLMPVGGGMTRDCIERE